MPESWRDRIDVSSAGTAASDGMKAAENAVKVLAEIKINLPTPHAAISRGR